MPNNANVVNADTYRKDRAAQDLLNWLDSQKPGTKAEILSIVGPQTMGQVESSTGDAPWYSKVIEAAGQVANTYFQGKVQKETTDLQIQRARDGLPPLDLSLYGPAPMTVQHQITAPGQVLSPQTKTLLWVGAGLVGVLLLLPLLTRKR